jgi:DNA-binding NtrC family response regulator
MAQASKIAHRLLAVDDDADSTDLVVRTALKCGYEAFPLNDAREIRQSIVSWRPHVVTVDLCMPNLDGIELFTLMAEHRFRGHVIIISGQSDWFREQAAALAAQQGLQVAGHMGKPVALAELRTLLTVLRVGLLGNEGGTLATDSTIRIVPFASSDRLTK